MAHLEPSAEISASDTVAEHAVATRSQAARCLNCGAAPTGPFCQECGQSQDDLRRPIFTLIREMIASFIDVDGRLMRTLPRLFFNPASLSRDYLAGERMSQTPPLRMLFLAVLLAFFLGSITDGQSPARQAAPAATPAPGVFHAAASGVQARAWVDRAGWAHSQPAEPRSQAETDQRNEAASEWVERLAVLSVPLAALALGMLFAFNSRWLMFDHLVFSMHSLTVLIVIFSLVEFAQQRVALAGWLMWLIPVHVFFHLRGTYRLSIIGTILRMLVLSVLGFISLTAFALIIIAASGMLFSPATG